MEQADSTNGRSWRQPWNKLKHPSQFSKPQLAVFVLAFALIGYLLFKTFAAAPVVATLQAEQMTPSGNISSSSTGFTTSLTDGKSLSAPYMWTFNPGVDTSAGYFFADGKQLAKITGPGPYAFRLSAGALSGGAHQLGHSWDTTAGVHQTPPSAYNVTISNTSNTDFATSVTNNSTVTPPYTWAFDPGTASSAGYFFADGKQLAKITGPGPYVYTLTAGVLSAGSHKLGHSWDTSSGSHKTPHNAYSVTVAKSSSTASNYSVINDSNASGGQAAKFGGGVSLSGSAGLSAAGTSLTVTAHGEQCSGAWPQMTVAVDGTNVLTTTVATTSWTGYTANLSLTAGTHTLKITNSSSGSCLPNLYTDATNFYGVIPPPPTPPTVALSASPTSVTAGQSATLTWNSTNATSCSASGAWSGSQPTSGSLSTGALNQNSTYSLTCTGTGGSASASTTVTVTVASQSFESMTNWARPSPATTNAASAAGWRLVAFSTLAGLNSAISNMQPHDYIYYNGTGVLSISSSTGNAYTIANHNPSSQVVIDFGASHDLWDATKVSQNYVQFSRPSGSAKGWDGVFLHDVSNLRIFGGDIGSNLYGGGIRIMGNTHDVTWWDFYVHNIGGSGVGIQPITQSGATSSIQNLNLRGEVNRFALNPSLDPHADKGTGVHGVIIHGNSGHYDNSTLTVYAHDSLRPGESSLGLIWPEGGGGSAVEAGTNSTGGPTSQNNDKYYVKGDNLLMIPNGTNPGSTAKQTGGNVINAWGSVPLNGNDFVWIEGNNITGAVMHGTGGGWYPGSPAILVEHGRHTKTNQQPNLGNIGTNPYQTGYGINYQDCL
jgi:P pilus assembly chaperone PapD